MCRVRFRRAVKRGLCEYSLLFFWVGGIGNGKRRLRDPWSSSYVHSMDQIYVFMFCITSYIIIFAVSVVVVSVSFADPTAGMCWFGVW